jgi:hypothetical protein
LSLLFCPHTEDRQAEIARLSYSLAYSISAITKFT